MSRELTLARRLLEAAADPYAPPEESDAAAAELAAFAVRYGVPEPSGFPIRMEHFEGVRVDDLSPLAWLLLLENAGPSDPEVPTQILEALFHDVGDEVVRLRLVSGSLAHPQLQKAFLAALDGEAAPVDIDGLPDCWPKARLERIEAARDAETFEGSTPSDALQEVVLYLLQDGTAPALIVAAAAITPDEPWRAPAHALASNLVRGLDPNLSGFGSPFRRARL